MGRTFFWSENILWKEDVLDHPCTVFLAEKDAIINAAKVRTYLQEDQVTFNDTDAAQYQQQRYKTRNLPKVMWCPELDHGGVFDWPDWRARLKKEVLGQTGIEVRKVDIHTAAIAA